MAWNLLLDDTFNRADTGTGGAGSTTGWGNGWTDKNGGAIYISGGIGYSAGAPNGYVTRFGVRPETSQDQRITFDIPAFAGQAVAWYVLCRFQNTNDGYLFGISSDGTNFHTQSYAQVGGATNSIGSNTSGAATNGHTYECDCQVTGINPTTYTVTITDTTTSTVLCTQTGTDSTAGLQNGTGTYAVSNYSASVNVPYARIRTYNATTTSPLGPGTISVNSQTASSINLTYSGESGGTSPYARQWYRSSTSGVQGTAISGATGLTLTDSGLTPGTTYYYEVVSTDSASGSVTSAQVSAATSAGGTDFPVQAAWLSPYNWQLTGGYAVSQNPGCYVDVNVTLPGGTAGTIYLVLDNSTLVGLDPSVCPIIRYSVDNAPFTDVTLASTNDIIQVGTGLAAGLHHVRAYLKTVDYATDKWNFPTSCFKLVSIRTDASATIASASSYTKNAIIYGDSITMGVGVNSPGGEQPTANESTAAYPRALGYALGCNVGSIPFSGQGWQFGAGGDVPTFPLSWNYYSNTRGRLTGGLLSPVPDYAFVMMGTNDYRNSVSDSTLNTDISGWMTAFRAAAPTTLLFMVVPPAGFTHNAHRLAMATYGGALTDKAVGGITVTSCANDSKAFLVYLGDNLASGIGPATGSSLMSIDGLHPSTETHGIIASGIVEAVTSVTTTGGTYPTTSQIAAAVAAAMASAPVGSVTGAVGSVTGNVGGSVASVTGAVSLNLTQAVPASNTAGTVGDALNAARAEGFGKAVYDPVAKTFKVYASDNTTVIKTFSLTTDASGTILGRA